jgi:membrane protease YdiL (CAAX protease family)
MGARLDAAREVAVAFVGIAIATVIVSWTPVSVLDEYRHLILAALFLATAIRLGERQPDGLARYGLRLGGLLDRSEDARPGALGALRDLGQAVLRAAPHGVREFGIALAVAALVFPPFVVGFYLWHRPSTFVLRWPEALPSYFLTQLLVVALPEEALFRGYFQGRSSDAFEGRTVILGASLSPVAWIVQALLFALLHLATDLRAARLAVFFPGLLFGWLRERRGGIGAALVLHALCNLLADVLARSWS